MRESSKKRKGEGKVRGRVYEHAAVRVTLEEGTLEEGTLLLERFQTYASWV